MYISHYDSLDGNLSLKLTIFVFFAVLTPLQRDIVPPEIFHLDKIVTLLFLEGPSPYVQGIFWDSDLIKVV